MVERDSSQVRSAQVAAKARQAIAEKIADLVPGVEDDAAAQVISRLLRRTHTSRRSRREHGRRVSQSVRGTQCQESEG
jgi:hypothetical protein